ncbi:fibrobacter succinogenes major paralogous domain-containing protein [Elizabethkingia anophelis]|uniref:fibrobacter succinogenes major paralogous domain-containing protein n=2 Tax=Elizabethkingia anophelis TaxID=1117645 RepID=UPI00200EE415|nr:fibrobacter succinogenes major paralogous domain-containing protein [Elizabethkingia anophelis]MCL1034903.1 fibrobacter succinogenes major paralogous domain-containing protein [Elizabethkingia anophelis]
MKKEMKSNIKLTITRIILVIFSLVIISCRQSDDHITDPGTETGPASVKINLQGSDYNDGGTSKTAGVNGINSAAVQTEEISFNNTNDYKLVATLTPEASSNPRGKTGITGINPLPDGIRYNVAVFDSNGNYVTERTYFTGSESSMPAITGLNGGSTYTFVVYSIGTTTGLPAINFTDPNNKTLATATLNDVSRNVDLMYFSKTLKISGNNTNYLDVVLQHKYSLITTTIDSTPTKYYTIGSITNATITPHYSSATLNLSNGSVTRANTSSRPVGFSGSGTTLTANPIFFNTEATSNGIFKIETVVLQKNNGFQVTHQNVSFNNLKIAPGVKYNLKLSFVPNDRYITNFRGYPAVSINGVIFMRHNLGANTSSNPDIPSVNIAGNYYQWGRKAPVATATTGTGAIPGWNTTVAPQGAWNSGTRVAPIKNTLNDPCPTGWRVISRDELGTLVDNTTHSYTGNAATSSIGSAAAVLTSKFNTSVKVTLPFTGFRDGADGRFSHASGTTLIDGNYWSADHVDDIGRLFTLFTTTGSGFWSALNLVNTRAMPVRCVAEYPY